MANKLPYESVIVHPLPNGWKVLEPIIYKDIFIGVGYFTNGANIPRVFHRLIAPNDPQIFPAIVIHDFLCDKMQYVKADNYLEFILIDSNIPKWKRISIVGGVRYYTKIGRPLAKKTKKLWGNIFG